MNKKNSFMIRLTDVDVLRLKVLSDTYNLSKSDFVRFMLVKELNSNENAKIHFNNILQHDRFSAE